MKWLRPADPVARVERAAWALLGAIAVFLLLLSIASSVNYTSTVVAQASVSVLPSFHVAFTGTDSNRSGIVCGPPEHQRLCRSRPGQRRRCSVESLGHHLHVHRRRASGDVSYCGLLYPQDPSHRAAGGNIPCLISAASSVGSPGPWGWPPSLASWRVTPRSTRSIRT